MHAQTKKEKRNNGRMVSAFQSAQLNENIKGVMFLTKFSGLYFANGRKRDRIITQPTIFASNKKQEIMACKYEPQYITCNYQTIALRQVPLP